MYRARLSGLDINTEILDPDYRKEAELILERRPDDEVVFETPIERASNVFSGLYKVMTKPVDKEGKKSEPEYSGKIVMVLGYMDELLINTLTYDAINNLRTRKQNRLKQEIQAQLVLHRHPLKNRNKQTYHPYQHHLICHYQLPKNHCHLL